MSMAGCVSSPGRPPPVQAPDEPGRVTVSGKPSHRIPVGTLGEHSQASWLG